MGKKNVCLISIHTNAAGNYMVDCLYRAAELWLPGHKLRKDPTEIQTGRATSSS